MRPWYSTLSPQACKRKRAKLRMDSYLIAPTGSFGFSHVRPSFQIDNFLGVPIYESLRLSRNSGMYCGIVFLTVPSRDSLCDVSTVSFQTSSLSARNFN